MNEILNKILCGDALQVLRTLPDNLVNMVVTSPPYWGLRDYGVNGQLGLEENPEQYLEKMVEIFQEVRRVLRPDGTLWLNLGDSYASGGNGGGGCYMDERIEAWSASYNHRLAKKGWRSAPEGLKHKDLVGIPWRVALALQADGWYLRQDIIWYKPNPMPESCSDRCTKAHEYLFLMSKRPKYFYDQDAIKETSLTAGQVMKKADGWDSEPGAHGTIHRKGREKGIRSEKLIPDRRNRRSVWEVATEKCPSAHFATFPKKLIEPCIKAGCPKDGIVLDPFMGSGTTAVVSKYLGRNYLGVEINPEYIEIAENRLEKTYYNEELF